ncbi:MAG TPA: hypothetical protein PKC28_11930, partial [Bdellovibrionales bacterium]|nr:hypothetical protein [Bdellovibrionales bacterium]
MRFIWALGAIAAAVGLGCHSVPLRNPPGGNAAANKEWLDEYKRAKADIARNPEAACARFRKLSREEKFPGRDIANLRRWQTCKDPQSAGIDRQALPPYLQDMALDVGLALAAIGGDKAAELTLATEKSREKLPQREKLRWLELAIRRAEELKQEDQIKELVKRVHMVAPRLIPDPQPSQYLTVAGDFRMSRNFAKAHEYYEKVFSDPGFGLDDKVTALKGRRLAYKNARQMEAHLTASKRLVDYLYRAIKLNPKSNAVKRATYDAELFYGRALWTQGQIAAAGAVFDHVEKRLKGKVSLAELYWLKGRMAEEENDLKKVSEYFTLALAEKSPNQDIRDKILWYDAWNERRLKNYPRAAEVLKMLETETAGDFTRVRARYWLGKTQDDQGDKDQAKATLERLIADDALGYYGLLAHRHLGLEIAFKKPLVQGGATALSDLPIDGTVAEWLALLEEREALTALLDGASSAYRKQRGQTDDGWILLFRYYAKGGLYQKLYETLAALPGERRKSLVETQLEL